MATKHEVKSAATLTGIGLRAASITASFELGLARRLVLGKAVIRLAS